MGKRRNTMGVISQEELLNIALKKYLKDYDDLVAKADSLGYTEGQREMSLGLVQGKVEALMTMYLIETGRQYDSEVSRND